MHIHTSYYFFTVAKNVIVDCMCNTASIYMTAYTGMQLRASHQLISPTEREFIPAEISLDPKLAKLISEPVQFLAIVVFLSKDILKSVFLISMFLLKIRKGVEDKGLRHKVIEIQPLLNHTTLFASTFIRKNANQNLSLPLGRSSRQIHRLHTYLLLLALCFAHVQCTLQYSADS